jgi:hypothetical protein
MPDGALWESAGPGWENCTSNRFATSFRADRALLSVVFMTMADKTPVIMMLLADAVAPLGIYYGLRLFEVNVWWALIASGLVSLVRSAYTINVRRKVDKLALFVFAAMVLSTVVSLLAGDPRLLLARDSWTTALIGVTLLVSGFRRPLLLDLTLPLMPQALAREWEESWRDSARFRRGIRVANGMWGAAFLIDAIARVVMAYTLPIDSVQIASYGLLFVLLVVARQLSLGHGRRMGVRFGAGDRAGSPTPHR